MSAIDLSVFDLFKIGPGPSSSHTIGPMLAAGDFLRVARGLPSDALARVAGVEVRLFGSLSATGRGHGTVRTVLAGLLGRAPEDCPPEFLEDLGRDPFAERHVDLGALRLPVSARNVFFDAVVHSYACPNTLIMRLLASDGGEPVLEREYASLGGGFIQTRDQPTPTRGAPVHPYATMRELRALAARTGLPLHRIVLENETAITGADEAEIYAGVDTILRVMDESVSAGLAVEGALPGPIGLQRKARHLLERAQSLCQPTHESGIGLMCAYAFAAAEENAAGHIIVTAPTCGSAGIIPAIARVMRTRLGLPEQGVRDGLLAAAAVGFLAKHNATIAGAEGGCQAEIGVAAAMAAAMVAHAAGSPVEVTENAAETALEQHLGLTCDPVGGYVQIPCIERNAMSVVKAYTAFVIASDVAPTKYKVGLDQAIETMLVTGRDMNCKYKETAEGGLAVVVARC